MLVKHCDLPATRRQRYYFDPMYLLLLCLCGYLSVIAASSVSIDAHGAVDDDPLTAFRLMYPSDGAVETLPVEFRYEVGTKTMEGYLRHYQDKVLCVELSGGWIKCSPMTDPKLVFDSLPRGNYTTRGFITDADRKVRYHKTEQTKLAIVSGDEFEEFAAAKMERAREETQLPKEVTLIEWATTEGMKLDPIKLNLRGEEDTFLVIGVKTAVVENFPRRQAIRDTWASELPRRVKVVFVGCAPNLRYMSEYEQEQLQNAIRLEKNTYGDLLTDELDCNDSYADLTNKVKEFLRFAVENFTQTPVVMIADDDIYLRVTSLVDYLEEVGRFKKLYFGQVWDEILGRKQVPVRDVKNRYYLPREIYRINSFPPFAFGPHYIMSMDCASFIARNAGRLSGLLGMDDISVSLWLLLIQVHVEHTVRFANLRIQNCRNSLISFADLSPLGIRSIHENLLNQREFCHGFDKTTWHRRTQAAERKFTLPLTIKTSVTDVYDLGVLQVSSTITSGSDANVTISYFPSVETFNYYSARVCSKAKLLVGNVHAQICQQIASVLRSQFQRLYQETREAATFASPYLELWGYNLFNADLNASPVIVAYSSGAAYSAVVLESLFKDVFEHEHRPVLVIPEKVLQDHYKVMPDVFVFSVLDADCEPLSKPNCQKKIEHYINDYSGSADGVGRSAKIMMVSGEATDMQGLDERVSLLSTISRVDREKHLYVSVASLSFGERLEHSPAALLSSTSDNGSTLGRKFCAYLYARCDRPQREYMFDVLNAMEPVDALGSCAGSLRPPNTTRSKSRYSKWYNDDAVHIFQSYKFVIAFENSPAPGYITEKLINPFLAGSIPVYLGNSTTVSQVFNPDSFIDCGLFDKLYDCAEFVVKVHHSPDLYAQMRRQPPIRNVTAFNEAFSWHPAVPSRVLADRLAEFLS